MVTFTPEDNERMGALLRDATYLSDATGEEPYTDPDLTVADVIERATHTAPTDPEFPALVADARALVSFAIRDDPTNTRLLDAANELDRLSLVSWDTGLEDLFASASEFEDTVCIMAVPAEDDPVHGIGPEDKHATLLYFGDIKDHDDPARMEASKDWMKEILWALTEKIPPFRAEVTGVEPLGDGGAQVWMLDSPNLQDLFGGIRAADDEISELYDGADATRYPEYTPHVTVGYLPDPEAGDTEDQPVSPEDLQAAKDVKEITFDRLSLWWGNEHIDFPLLGDPDTSEFEALFSLVASGFRANQIRVPKGNGQLSGRWVDTPLTIMNKLDHDLGEMPVNSDADERVRRVVQRAQNQDLNDPDLTSDDLQEIFDEMSDDLSDAAAAASRDGTAGKASMERIFAAATELRGLAEVDWSLRSEDTDLTAPGENDLPEPVTPEIESVNWSAMTDTEIREETGNALATFMQAANDASEEDALLVEEARAVQQGMTARLREAVRATGLPITVEPIAGFYDGYSWNGSWGFYGPDGAVGSIDRTIFPGDSRVHNAFFKLEPAFQNGGLGSAITRELEGWYEDNGVEQVTVTANIDVGGYTWARLGFDLNPAEENVKGRLSRFITELVMSVDGTGEMPMPVQRLFTHVLEGRVGDREFDIMDGTGVLEDFDAFAALLGMEPDDLEGYDAEDLLDMLWNSGGVLSAMPIDEFEMRDRLMAWTAEIRDAGIYGEVEDISMYEIATFGQGSYLQRVDTQVIYSADLSGEPFTQEITSWPGKQALVHSEWEGVKFLGGGGS